METLLKKYPIAAALAVASTGAFAAELDPANCDRIVEKARAETGCFNACGGSRNIGSHLEWPFTEGR